MSKTPQELLSIGEFAGISELSVKMLRHYDEIGLLNPAFVDANGYRYYRYEQAVKGLAIAELRKLDMPLAEIAEVVNAKGPCRAHELLEGHRERLGRQLADAERRLAHIERVLRREPTMAYEITEQSIAAQRVVSKRMIGPNTAESNQAQLSAGLAEVWAAITSAGGTRADITGSPVVVIHYGDESRFEQEVCIPVDNVTPSGDVVVRELEEVWGAVARHVGGRPQPREIMDWANGKGHKVGLPYRVVLVAVPPFFGEGDEMVSDIVIPYRQ